MKEGQTVWFTDSLFYRRQGLVEGEFVTVGRIYVTVKAKNGNGRELKFNKKTLRREGNTNNGGRLYLTKEEYYNGIELTRNIRQLQEHFGTFPKVTLEQTRRILTILNEGADNNEH